MLVPMLARCCALACKAGARTPTRPHPRLKVRLNVGARAAL